MRVIAGLDPNQVDSSPLFALGERGSPNGISEYIYLEADGTIDASDAVIVHTDMGAEALTTTLAAASTGQGKLVAVSPPSGRSQAIVDGKFFWGCIYDPGVSDIAVNVKGATVDFTQLYTSATAGHLDDAFVSAGKVIGIVVETTAGSADQAEIAVINYPHIASDVDTATGGGG